MMPIYADHKMHVARPSRRHQDVTDDNTRTIAVLYMPWHNLESIHTWVMRNLVSLSGSLPFSLERIISSMSPWSFSITTNTFSGVSNMHSRFTMPRWRKLWDKDQRGGKGVGERGHQECYENCFKKKGWMSKKREWGKRSNDRMKIERGKAQNARAQGEVFN